MILLFNNTQDVKGVLLVLVYVRVRSFKERR